MKQIDHRIRITKMLIQKSFLKLLMEKPASAITVKELCEDAGINRGTFYNNYNDTQDLLMQIEEDMFQEFKRALEPMLTETVTPYDVIFNMFSLIRENSELFYITLSPNGDKSFLERVLRLGKEHASKSYNRTQYHIPQEKIDIHYTFVSGGCVAILQQWLMGNLDMSVEEISRHIEDIVINGYRYLFPDF